MSDNVKEELTQMYLHDGKLATMDEIANLMEICQCGPNKPTMCEICFMMTNIIEVINEDIEKEAGIYEAQT